MEIEIEFETKNLDPISLVFIGDAIISNCNSDCGYSDGEVLAVNGNFCYQSNGNAVGSLVEKYLWAKHESYITECAKN